jgi:hypothetical protein
LRIPVSASQSSWPLQVIVPITERDGNVYRIAMA